jgi:hypothetical protein
MGAPEQLAAGGLRVGQVARPHQADRLLGQQRVPVGIGRRAELEGPPQQVHGDGRGTRRGPAGGPPQPGDRLGVAGRRAPHQVLGDPLGRRPGPGEGMSRVEVQATADRGRQVMVERLTDQVVAERQLDPAVVQDAPGHRLGHGVQQPGGWPAEHPGQVGDRKGGAKDRGDPQHLQRGRCQEAQPVQDRQRQRRWDADRRELGRAVRPRDRAVAQERGDQFGHPQRVAARSRDLAQQTGTGCGTDQLLDQLGHGRLVQGSEHQLGRPVRP